MPQEIHLTNIPVELYETNQYGEVKCHKATVDEILMDTDSKPYQIVLTWKGKSRRITPKYDKGRFLFRTRTSTYEGFVDE